ncbi:hypothetical protein JCM15765_13540 [Paradesulfitobacterium aromaticivorans]
MIVTNNLTKTYKNGFRAVDRLNLAVGEGDIYGFLGPNGAGKTTTIRMLNGLMKPTKGQVWIEKKDINQDVQAVKRIIGVLPESHGYYPWMTGQEYLAYFSKLFEQDPREAKSYIPFLLDKVGLKDKHKLIGHYSRGMRQRLGLAKTLINHPKVIFLDEPTLGLDPMGQKEIQNHIIDLNQSLRVTVFITSHLLKDIEVLCNKVGIVKEGKLIEQGEIKDLHQKYGKNNMIKLRTSDNLAAKTILEGFEGLRVEVKGELIYSYFFQTNLSALDQRKREIVGLLFAEGIDIHEIGNVETSIEDIFLDLVGGAKEGGEKA